MEAKYCNLLMLFFILLLSVIQSPAQQEAIFKKFAGTYATGHQFGGGSITLKADGTFSKDSGSDDGTMISTSGNYTLSDEVLIFKITKQTGKRFGDGKELNLLDPEERNQMSSGFASSKIETEFKYLPIEWSDRIYLMDESELKNFSNAINLGIEPRPSLYSMDDSSPWYGSFYLRSGDEGKKVRGVPKLPAEWLSFLLRKPLAPMVISIQDVDKRQFITIANFTVNKGAKDGLKVGMRLLTNDEVPSQWDGPEVISVEGRTAKIKARLSGTELKVGDKLTTKYNPRMLYR